MAEDPIDQPSEELLSLQRAAEKNNNGYNTLWGFLIAPLAMGFTWYLTNDTKAVRNVGVLIFCVSSIVFAVAFTRFTHHSDKLKNVKQQYSVMVPGVLGPIKENYWTKYEFSQFSTQDCVVHQKAHFWAVLGGGSAFTLISWLITINYFNYFVWK